MEKSLLLLCLPFFWLAVQPENCHRRLPAPEQKFIFLGHPYNWNADGDRVDPRLEKIDYQQFNQVWLGGDVCSRTTEKETTLAYLDSIFRFKNGNIHWALGNHDLLAGNFDRIKKHTGRESFYYDATNGVSIFVLNTLPFFLGNPDECELMDVQIQLLRNVADTISKVSYLIVLHHHCLLTNERAGGRFRMDTIFNLYRPDYLVNCENAGTFDEIMYPILKKIQQKGVQVVLVGGDFGMRKKEFQFQTADGIWFLGSGINNSVKREFAPEYVTNFEPDKILIFHRNPAKKQLRWEFVDLNDFANRP